MAESEMAPRKSEAHLVRGRFRVRVRPWCSVRVGARKSEAHTAPSTGLTVAASCCTW